VDPDHLVDRQVHGSGHLDRAHRLAMLCASAEIWSSTFPSRAAATSARDGPWARCGYNVPSKTGYLGPRYPLTSRFIVSGRTHRPQHPNAALTAPEMALHQVFCGPRWNRTVGLNIIRAELRAGQAIGIPSDVPFRARACHRKALRATSLGHALGTAWTGPRSGSPPLCRSRNPVERRQGAGCSDRPLAT
jgi:hypothetical protein